MAGNTQQEWLNRNAYRAFPFVENTDFTCRDGAVLPLSAILDARFCLFGEGECSVTLDSAEISNDGSVAMKFRTEGRQLRLTSENGVAVLDRYPHSCRVLTGDPEYLKEFAGTYTLKTPARILQSRVLSVPYGIGADTLDVDGESAFGDIEVVDGHNTALEIENNNLVLRVGYGLGKGVVCPEDPEPGPVYCNNVLYFINGQGADSDGGFSILAGEGISVKTGYFDRYPAVYVSTNSEVDNFMRGN